MINALQLFLSLHENESSRLLYDWCDSAFSFLPSSYKLNLHSGRHICFLTAMGTPFTCHNIISLARQMRQRPTASRNTERRLVWPPPDFRHPSYRRFPSGTPVSSTIKIDKLLISSIIGSSEGGFTSRDKRKWAEKMWNMKPTEWNWEFKND
jgi:hypothetical protein